MKTLHTHNPAGVEPLRRRRNFYNNHRANSNPTIKWIEKIYVGESPLNTTLIYFPCTTNSMDIIIYTVIGTAILIGIVAYVIHLKNKNDEWQGELADKKEEVRTDSNDVETTVYALHIKTQAGTERKVFVKKKIYQQFSVGDYLIKTKGETTPKKK
jgi:hypothetical protein